jgi:hypothetical protein
MMGFIICVLFVNGGMLLNNALEMMLKDSLVAYFLVLSSHLPCGTEENYKNP